MLNFRKISNRRCSDNKLLTTLFCLQLQHQGLLFSLLQVIGMLVLGRLQFTMD